VNKEVATEPPQPPEPPQPAGPPPPEQPKRPIVPLWGKITIVVSALLVVVVIAGFVIHVPYTTISPGAAEPLAGLVSIDGAKTFPEPRGDIRLLFVRERNHVSLWRYLRAKLDDNTEILKDAEATGGLPLPDAEANAVADMADAKVSATKVALQAAGFTIKPPSGVVVEATMPSTPDAAVLHQGDVIRSAAGKKVVSGSDLSKAVKAHKPGDTIAIGLERDGKPQTVHVRLSKASDGSTVIGVRVFPDFQFPVKVSVDTAGIGGPSAGLAMTLAILDKLTPGDLTGGKRVAVTGTIDPDGNVGEIGGIEQKGVSARAAHAQLFIVPQCSPQDPPDYLTACRQDLVRLRKRAGSKVKIIPVSNFQQALQALRDNGGEPVVKTAPVTNAA
jgi:PDZ domain-containing protein